MFLKFYSFFVRFFFLVFFNHYGLHALCFARVCAFFFLPLFFYLVYVLFFVTIVHFICALHMYLCALHKYMFLYNFFSCLIFLQGFNFQSVVHCVKIQQQEQLEMATHKEKKEQIKD